MCSLVFGFALLFVFAGELGVMGKLFLRAELDVVCTVVVDCVGML